MEAKLSEPSAQELIQPEFTVGSVLTRALTTLMKNFGVFFVIAVIFMIPDVLVDLFVLPKIESLQMRVLTGNISSSLFGSLVTGGILYGVVQSLGGGSASLGKCLNVAMARFIPILLVSFLFGLGVTLGMLAIIIPGIILMCMWYVAVPATVIEKTGVIESFSRSAELTKGHRWTLFFVGLAFTAVGLAVLFLVIAPLVAGGASGLVVALILFAVALTFGLWANVAAGVAYHDLRVIKEGATSKQLADVFA